MLVLYQGFSRFDAVPRFVHRFDTEFWVGDSVLLCWGLPLVVCYLSRLPVGFMLCQSLPVGFVL